MGNHIINGLILNFVPKSFVTNEPWKSDASTWVGLAPSVRNLNHSIQPTKIIPLRRYTRYVLGKAFQ